MPSRVRWGQCFLVDDEAALRIVKWAAVDGLPVVEIGPGRGALTGHLRERASSLTLIEIDPVLAAQLVERYSGDDQVTVVNVDALRVDWATVAAASATAATPGFTVVSNLPYESGTAIVASLLQRRELLREMVVMLQKEVVARLGAAPGGKVYGALSVIVQMTSDVEKGMVVAPRSFRPRPKVESQIVRIRPLASPRFDLGDEAGFPGFVHAAFAQRRKMLRNNLGRYLDSRYGKDAGARVMERAGIAGNVRPEELTLAEFAALSREAFAEGRAFAAAAKDGPVSERVPDAGTS